MTWSLRIVPGFSSAFPSKSSGPAILACLRTVEHPNACSCFSWYQYAMWKERVLICGSKYISCQDTACVRSSNRIRSTSHPLVHYSFVNTTSWQNLRLSNSLTNERVNTDDCYLKTPSLRPPRHQPTWPRDRPFASGVVLAAHQTLPLLSVSSMRNGNAPPSSERQNNWP